MKEYIYCLYAPQYHNTAASLYWRKVFVDHIVTLDERAWGQIRQP